MNTTLTLAKTFEDLFKDMNKFAIGFEPHFKVLDQVRNSTIPNYPPYDIEIIDETHYKLVLALAGFTKEDLSITVQNKTLTIVGDQKTDSTKNYLFKGIAGRSFTRTFYLDPTVHITNADFQDGILSIDFEQIIPESAKPKKIEIGNKTPEIDSSREIFDKLAEKVKSKTTKIMA